MSAALGALVDAVKARSGKKPLVIFDIDDTLLLTAHRNLRILKEFAGQPSVTKAWPKDAAALLGLRPESLKYSIVDSAKAAGVETPELVEELKGFWRMRFFTNAYLAADEPLPGAAPYCSELAQAGARIVYMTGRDETMRAGTEESLARHGFPKHELVLKPRFDTPDLEFKTQALARLHKEGSVEGAFENEPAHVNLFQAAFPTALMFFVETKHSGKPIEPHPAAARIKHFLRK
jgi:hypothetical protein